MKHYTLAFLQGDGVGPLLGSFWQEVLQGLGRRYGFSVAALPLEFGKSAYQSVGCAVPPKTLEGIRQADATLLCAVDTKGLPGSTPVGVLRKELTLFADVRPIRAYQGRWAFRPDLDLVMIRESTQGFLSDRNLAAGCGEWKSDEDSAFSLRVITYPASRRIAEFAFDYAKQNKRKTITVLHKEPIFKLTDGTFLRACRDVAAGYPEIALKEELVDNAANGLIAHPQDYDVLLTTNLYGDILSDEAAALVSSLAPSANLGPQAAVFLPVNHGPAYEALKENRYDIIPSGLCARMLLERLGELEAADALDAALQSSMAEEQSSSATAMERLIRALS